MIDFWSMVWERSSHAIVMLSLLEENGKVRTAEITCVSVIYCMCIGDICEVLA